MTSVSSPKFDLETERSKCLERVARVTARWVTGGSHKFGSLAQSVGLDFQGLCETEVLEKRSKVQGFKAEQDFTDLREDFYYGFAYDFSTVVDKLNRALWLANKPTRAVVMNEDGTVHFSVADVGAYVCSDDEKDGDGLVLLTGQVVDAVTDDKVQLFTSRFFSGVQFDSCYVLVRDPKMAKAWAKKLYNEFEYGVYVVNDSVMTGTKVTMLSFATPDLHTVWKKFSNMRAGKCYKSWDYSSDESEDDSSDSSGNESE